MNYYVSIDEFPLWNWRQCVEGLLNYTRINPKKGKDKNDLLAWEKLFDQNIERFGLAGDHERIIELKLELANLQCDYCIENSPFLLNRIKVLQADIKDILERAQEGATIDECLMALSKWMGFRLDQKVITVVEFNTYLKAYQAEGKQQKKAQNG